MPSVFIRNVTQLTDARYFAAMGVQWMSLLIEEDPKSFTRWHALRDWVEGVRLAADIGTNEESTVARMIIDARPDGIVSPSIDLLHLAGGVDYFLLTETKVDREIREMIRMIVNVENMATLPDWILNFDAEQIFIQTDLQIEVIKSYLQQGYEGGFCLLASGEQVTGIKDFSEWDQILELLGNQS